MYAVGFVAAAAAVVAVDAVVVEVEVSWTAIDA